MKSGRWASTSTWSVSDTSSTPGVLRRVSVKVWNSSFGIGVIHESTARFVQAGDAGRGVRRDQDRNRVARKDPLLVLRRGEEARDDQLPHLQAGAGRPVLRQDLRADQGLRMPVRQVQAPEAPRGDLREVRRRG